jgi:hypothetical protein
LIEDAYRLAPGLGLEVWCCDQAGPFQTVPHPGRSWRPEGDPARLPHEYVRNGTAKVLTLFHPITGRVRVEGVTSCPNAVLHPWLKRELAAVLAALPPTVPVAPTAEVRAAWVRWQAGLRFPIILPAELPALRMLLVLDNLAGHRTPDFVLWLFAHGVMPVYTPLSGSWLNMAESIQRVLKVRALDGQQPTHPDEIIGWFEAVAAHWNRDPTPFEWGGERAARRQRQRDRRHRVGGSGATTRRPLGRRNGYAQTK